MSDALYSTRLRWGNGQGVARMHGRSVQLAEAPVLGGVQVYAVDYTPEVHCVEIQLAPSEPKREMTAGQIADADRLLRRLVPLL